MPDVQDSWIHCQWKNNIKTEADLAGVPLDLKVFGKFYWRRYPSCSGTVSARGGSRNSRKPTHHPWWTSATFCPYFAELKVYLRGTTEKGTELRSRHLNKDYEDVIRGYKIRFHVAQPSTLPIPPPRQHEPPETFCWNAGCRAKHRLQAYVCISLDRFPDAFLVEVQISKHHQNFCRFKKIMVSSNYSDGDGTL